MAAAAPQVPKPRIQSLSDLIFGLALSIGAVQLVGSLPKTPSQLTNDLLYFGFSFLILINVWNRYTSTTSVMPVETPMMMRLNMALLFLVAIEPFLFDVLFVKGFSDPVGVEASVYYALDVGAMNLVLAYFTHLLGSEEKKLIPAEYIQRYRHVRNTLLVGAVIFFVSALPFFEAAAFDGTPFRVIIWILSLPILWGPRLFGRAGW